MLAKLFFLVSVVLFAILALGGHVDAKIAWWASASLAAGLLVEGYGPSVPR